MVMPCLSFSVSAGVFVVWWFVLFFGFSAGLFFVLCFWWFLGLLGASSRLTCWVGGRSLEGSLWASYGGSFDVFVQLSLCYIYIYIFIKKKK